MDDKPAAPDAALLAEVLDLLPAAVALWSRDRRLLYANRGHLEWFRTPEPLRRGGAMREVLGEALYQIALPHVQAVEAGQRQRFFGERKTRHGVRSQVARLLPRLDAAGQPDGHVVLVVDRDGERELALANARLAALVAHSDDAIISIDHGGTVETWNPGAERLFGYRESEIVGKDFALLVPPHLRDEAQALRARVLRGEHVKPFETLRQTQDGRLVPVSVSIFPVPDIEGRVLRVSAIIRDITALKAAEAALRASEEQFRVLAEAAPVGVYRTDAAGLCTYTNPALRAINGHSQEEALGPGWADFVHPEDREALARAWVQAAAKGVPFETQYRLVRPSGEVRHVLTRAGATRRSDCAIDGFVGAVIDITERVAVEAALEAGRTRLRQLYEATPAMLSSCDLQGQLLSVSDTWLTKLGRRRDEVIGRPLLNFVADASGEYLRGSAWPELLRESRVADVPLKMQAAGGEALDVVFSAVVEAGIGGEAASVLAVMEDVTEALRRNAELQRERRLRAEVERRAGELGALLEERSRMLDVLAHEVRQPLNNASAALQGAQAAIGSAAHEAFQPLMRAAQVLSEVRSRIDNTLAAAALLASDQPLATDDCEIDVLLALALGDLDATQRSRVNVRRTTSTRTAPMDLNLMRLALRNLVANALRYSAAPLPVEVVIADSDAPLGLLIDVHDRGPGFSADMLPRLFERGSRGSARSGSGLGLYIVRRVMQRHGGSVTLVHNEPGDVRLRLLLPPGYDET